MTTQLNLVWLMYSKFGIGYARKINIKYLFHLLFYTYSSTNSKFVMGFAVPTNLITYLTNVEVLHRFCNPHKRVLASSARYLTLTYLNCDVTLYIFFILHFVPFNSEQN